MTADIPDQPPTLPTLIVSDVIEHTVLCSDGTHHFDGQMPGYVVDRLLRIADSAADQTCRRAPHRHAIRHVITTDWSPAS